LLPRRNRLSKEGEIKRVLKARHYEGNSPLLYLVASDNLLENSRLAVVTPKKLGNAIVRNRLRRVFAAAFSKIRHNLAKNVDFVLFPRKSAAELGMQDAKEAIIDCIRGYCLNDQNS
jgi:ribonuclease P protein component